MIELTSGGISPSKCRVSSGCSSSGLNGAGYLRMLSQSIPLNQGWAWRYFHASRTHEKDKKDGIGVSDLFNLSREMKSIISPLASEALGWHYCNAQIASGVRKPRE